jgi:sorbitol/mannitol transport system permease protein
VGDHADRMAGCYLFFFPIFWMTITAFKTEKGGYSPDLIFWPTLESFADVFERSNYFHYAGNSIFISFGSTILAYTYFCEVPISERRR